MGPYLCTKYTLISSVKKLLLALTALIVLSSHDMFLRLDTYFLEPNSDATVKLYNGTFERSENVIDRDRMLDVSLLSGGKRMAVDTSAWTERDSATILSFRTGESGTYVAGVSTRSREIAMKADDFNNYLEHEGGEDMLVLRKRDNVLSEDAVERYSKHVKAIFQVGELRSTDWQMQLGYPIEFVPQSNPYDLHAGDSLNVELLRDGRALANQIVIVGSKTNRSHDHDHVQISSDADHEHDHTHPNGERHSHAPADDHDHDHDHVESHSEDVGHSHDGGTHLRTDANGIVTVPISHDGVWHMRTIHLTTVDEPEVTHESNWATLTFEVSHEQPHTHDDHAHEHKHEHGIPSYAYWIGSLALIGLLFLYFNRRR